MRGGFPPPLADRVTALQMHNVNRIEFAYDGFGRVTGRTYSNTSGANRRVTTYTYQDVGTDKTTTLLKSVNNSGFGELGYEYDAVGNITQITKDGTVQETYSYDALNQLKTVTRNGVTTEYNYQNGNITSARETALEQSVPSLSFRMRRTIRLIKYSKKEEREECGN